MSAALPPCGTLEKLQARPRPAVRLIDGASARDIYELPHSQQSAHFVARWGDERALPEGVIEPLLAAFELAWEVQVESMGHPSPVPLEELPFNVYIGDTGGPPSDGASGYFWYDDIGQPMIVIDVLVLDDLVRAKKVSTHEFYHAIQGVTERYPYSGSGAWYWEATAEWASIWTEPENPYNGEFVFAYLGAPTLPLNLFDYPDTDVLEEYHQYGAFLFPLDLAERLGPELIRDSWVVPGEEGDPMEVLRVGIAERGADLEELWLDHLAHNVVYDYYSGEAYRQNLEDSVEEYPDVQQVTVELPPGGAEGALDPEEGIGRYGAANLRLSAPERGTLEIRLTGGESGSLGSYARYGARLVRQAADGTYSMVPVPFRGVQGTLTVPDVGDEAAIWITVGAWSPNLRPARWPQETFPLSWSVAVLEPEPEPVDTGTATTGTTEEPPVVEEDAPPEQAACGCDSGTLRGGWGVLAILGLVRRRRR